MPRKRKPTEKTKNELQVVPESYSVDNAALMLGLGRSTVYNLIKEGKLKRLKVGKRTIVEAVEIRDFLARLRES